MYLYPYLCHDKILELSTYIAREHNSQYPKQTTVFIILSYILAHQSDTQVLTVRGVLNYFANPSCKSKPNSAKNQANSAHSKKNMKISGFQVLFSERGPELATLQ